MAITFTADELGRVEGVAVAGEALLGATHGSAQRVGVAAPQFTPCGLGQEGAARRRPAPCFLVDAGDSSSGIDTITLAIPGV